MSGYFATAAVFVELSWILCVIVFEYRVLLELFTCSVMLADDMVDSSWIVIVVISIRT